MSATWEEPGPEEVATAVAFINTQAPALHPGFGCPSSFDTALQKFVPFRPYIGLDESVRHYATATLGIEFEGDDWDGLCKRIEKAEEGYRDRKHGFWNSVWHKMGENTEEIDGWLELIPDEYGLGVVKAGLALVFKFAEKSVEKRKKIFDTFTTLRDVLGRADPSKVSFWGAEDVRDCTQRLYQTVVDSIDDLVQLTSKEMAKKRLRDKFKHKEEVPDVDDILASVDASTKAFEQAVAVARDRTIDGTAMVAQYTAHKTNLVHLDVNTIKDNTVAIKTDIVQSKSLLTQVGAEVTETYGRLTHVASDTKYLRSNIDKYATSLEHDREEGKIRHQELSELINKNLAETNKIAKRERQQHEEHSGSANEQLKEQLKTKDLLLEVLLEAKKKDAAEITRLKRKVNNGHSHAIRIDLDHFCQILAHDPTARGHVSDLQTLFEHSNKDLTQTLAQKGRINITVQSQVQSLLRHERFAQWIWQRHADLIWVDANIMSAATERLSAISTFSATFITTIVETQPETAVVFFFCGAHVSPADPWYGPKGLVRSLIVQLVMRLEKLDMLDLRFINSREQLTSLRAHNLDHLCKTLHQLVAQFPEDMKLYFVIDSIQWFERTRIFDDLRVVMDALKRIIEDMSLMPILKVLLTNSMRSSRKMKELPVLWENPSRIVSLSANNLVAVELSPRNVGSQIRRPLTPTPSKPRDGASGYSRTGREWDSDDDDYQSSRMGGR